MTLGGPGLSQVLRLDVPVPVPVGPIGRPRGSVEFGSAYEKRNRRNVLLNSLTVHTNVNHYLLHWNAVKSPFPVGFR